VEVLHPRGLGQRPLGMIAAFADRNRLNARRISPNYSVSTAMDPGAKSFEANNILDPNYCVSSGFDLVAYF